MKKISVCMATYNGEKYIKEQLDSILMQLRDDDEIIISDDSSIDKTLEIVKSYKDNRIKIYEYQKFKSPIFNFENALKHATGDIIVLSDQDDIWMTNKIQIIKECLNSYDLVLSDATIIDSKGNIIEQSFYKVNGSRKGFVKNIIKNSYLGCAMAFNRKILEKSLPFPKDIPMHDWWIGLIGEVCGKVYFIDKKLMNYRRHDNNVSNTGEKSNNTFFRKLLFRIIIIKNLILRCLNGTFHHNNS